MQTGSILYDSYTASVLTFLLQARVSTSAFSNHVRDVKYFMCKLPCGYLHSLLHSSRSWLAKLPVVYGTLSHSHGLLCLLCLTTGAKWNDLPEGLHTILAADGSFDHSAGHRVRGPVRGGQVAHARRQGRLPAHIYVMYTYIYIYIYIYTLM